MGDRGGQKRKIEDLMKRLNDVKATQQQQQQQLDSLTTRVVRIEKTTSRARWRRFTKPPRKPETLRT